MAEEQNKLVEAYERFSQKTKDILEESQDKTSQAFENAMEKADLGEAAPKAPKEKKEKPPKEKKEKKPPAEGAVGGEEGCVAHLARSVRLMVLVNAYSVTASGFCAWSGYPIDWNCCKAVLANHAMLALSAAHKKAQIQA
jgi:hypothetical protein